MTNRQAVGFLLGLFGVWMMWQAGMGMMMYIEQADGAKSFHQVLFEPKYALRMLTALAAFVGGLAALVEKNGGAWLAGVSSFIFGLLTFGLIANQNDVAEWRSEAIILVCLTGLFLTLVVARKESSEREEFEAEEAARLAAIEADRAETEAARAS
jgi:peptidoglycan/LPS O-acetylase OafA/YrhL